ncbi:hypothetical protein A0J61_03896 [Choanephora cucurbitarum]|uniref:Uncharacterized protein n=1 Tax=Choanephora cucurbitarum TaxID=101091 RepID=A0A1C7NG93_9FUNG|nr:hypothetical protein A0J61_03896 [Choanephora cucurbitarum]
MFHRSSQSILSFHNQALIHIDVEIHGKNVINDKLSHLFPDEQDHMFLDKVEKLLLPHLHSRKKESKSGKKMLTSLRSIHQDRIANFRQCFCATTVSSKPLKIEEESEQLVRITA